MSTTETPDGVDLDRLGPWFAANVPGYEGAPLTASLIAGGRSNLTYVVSDGATEWILRRPPLGHVLPTAHDMVREARVMGALHDTVVPVPSVLGSCDDLAVNDAPFYVMAKVDGIIYRDARALATLSAADAGRVSHALVDVLADAPGPLTIPEILAAGAALAEAPHQAGGLQHRIDGARSKSLIHSAAPPQG